LRSFVAHIASADDNGGLARRFVNEKKDRKLSAAERLTKRTVNVFAGCLSFFRETNARFAEENLSGFAKADMMF
jgi:hypothetical protein